MAATTAAFDISIQAYAPSERGLMAGASYHLRQLYQAGMTDPAAHTAAKSNIRQLSKLTAKSELASFDAITAP